MPIAAREMISSKRLRYASDMVFRNAAKAISRNGYRKKVGMETENCLHSLKFIDKAAKEYMVKPVAGGKPIVIRGFSVPQTAEILQQLYQTVWRWVSNGAIPTPIFSRVTSPGNNRPYLVYHLEEVRILVEEIGEHEKSMAYFRKDHIVTRNRIEKRISAFRKTLTV